MTSPISARQAEPSRMDLQLTNNTDDPLALYDDIVTLQQDLDETALMQMNARLVLILANQIGDRRLIRQALQAARAASIDDVPRDG